DDTAAPVLKPRLRSSTAIVRACSFSANPPSSRTRLSRGTGPETSAAWAGSVCGECVYARSKTMARPARASMFGVAPAAPPYAGSRSARRPSTVTRMIGPWGGGGSRGDAPPRERGPGPGEKEGGDDAGTRPALARGRRHASHLLSDFL